jgi:hypothetical protein
LIILNNMLIAIDSLLERVTQSTSCVIDGNGMSKDLDNMPFILRFVGGVIIRRVVGPPRV